MQFAVGDGSGCGDDRIQHAPRVAGFQSGQNLLPSGCSGGQAALDGADRTEKCPPDYRCREAQQRVCRPLDIPTASRSAAVSRRLGRASTISRYAFSEVGVSPSAAAANSRSNAEKPRCTPLTGSLRDGHPDSRSSRRRYLGIAWQTVIGRSLLCVFAVAPQTLTTATTATPRTSPLTDGCQPPRRQQLPRK